MRGTDQQKSGIKCSLGVQDSTDGNLIVQQLTPFRAKICSQSSSNPSAILNFAESKVSIENKHVQIQKELDKLMCAALIDVENRSVTCKNGALKESPSCAKSGGQCSKKKRKLNDKLQNEGQGSHSQGDPEGEKKKSIEGADELDDDEHFTDGNNDGFGEESVGEPGTGGKGGTNAARKGIHSQRSDKDQLDTSARDNKSVRRSKRMAHSDPGKQKTADIEGNGTDRPGTDDQPGAKRQCNEGNQRTSSRTRGKTMSCVQRQKNKTLSCHKKKVF